MKQKNEELYLGNSEIDVNEPMSRNKRIQTSVANGLNQMHQHVQEISPVAWIIIVSESLHNFIDGLSIGCAFNETILKGASLSIAIICEEFPHKLGNLFNISVKNKSVHLIY